MTRTPNPVLLGQLRDELQRRLPDFLADLETMVNVESGSYTEAGVDEVATSMGDRLAGLGASVVSRSTAIADPGDLRGRRGQARLTSQRGGHHGPP